MAFHRETNQRIDDMKTAVEGAPHAVGSQVWVVNDLACEGQNHAVTSLAKALAVPVDGGERNRHIFGDSESEFGAPFTVMGGEVAAGEKVFVLVIGDRGCVSAVLGVYKDKAAAEGGEASIATMAENGGWGAGIQELTVDAAPAATAAAAQ